MTSGAQGLATTGGAHRGLANVSGKTAIFFEVLCHKAASVSCTLICLLQDHPQGYLAVS